MLWPRLTYVTVAAVRALRVCQTDTRWFWLLVDFCGALVSVSSAIGLMQYAGNSDTGHFD